MLSLVLPVVAGPLTLAAILLITVEPVTVLRVSAVRLAAGIGIGVLYVTDTRRWSVFLAALAVGALLAFVLQGLPLVWTVVSVAIGLGVNAATAALLKSWLPAGQPFESPASALWLLAPSACSSCAMRCDTAGWLECSFFAAARKPPSVAMQ